MKPNRSRKRFFNKRRIIFLLVCTLCTVFIYSIRTVRGEHCFANTGSSFRSSFQVGIASWYGKRFHGRKTAAGERYNMYGLTAAHPSLPLGSIVKVKNLSNNREVIVRINDRGPYIKGRIIDLSLAAACELRMVRKGITKVEITVLPKNI
ncbi:MAG: septal ring lytic transglycosylase RlpA family protein [Candidatus Omnitrophica bacterium]|nr:septal ring lytic transglycosylase RlpA family protein [Candidatus Omnitrophota bacterium]